MYDGFENGGFILAEACCGSPEFDAGFKKLVKELWPDQTLDYLDGEHPVWHSFFKNLKPGQVSRLMGLQMGCKTVLIYSPQDLSCRWESNELKDGNVEFLKAIAKSGEDSAEATSESRRPHRGRQRLASTRHSRAERPRSGRKPGG